jgi:hypothetical protein
MLNAIDFPDTHEACSRRNQTTTAPQALTLLNSSLTANWSREFAARVERAAGPDRGRQVREAFALAYARQPDATELDTSLTFLAKQTETTGSASAALADFCLMLLNSNEFVYLF